MNFRTFCALLPTSNDTVADLERKLRQVRKQPPSADSSDLETQLLDALDDLDFEYLTIVDITEEG